MSALALVEGVGERERNDKKGVSRVWVLVCCLVCFIHIFSSLSPTCSLPSSPPSSDLFSSCLIVCILSPLLFTPTPL